MHRRAILAATLLAGALVGLARAALLVVHVDGASMRPSYEPGDRLLAIRREMSRPLRYGDVVVVRAPRRTWLAGDPTADAEVVVVKRVMAPPPGRPGQPVLGVGELWVEGDARDSYDSRQFGPLRRDAVVGRVIARVHRAAAPARH